MAWTNVLRTLGLGAFARGARPDMGYAAPTYQEQQGPPPDDTGVAGGYGTPQVVAGLDARDPRAWQTQGYGDPRVVFSEAPPRYVAQGPPPSGTGEAGAIYGDPRGGFGTARPTPTPMPSNRNDPPPPVPFGFTDDAARARWQADYAAWQSRNGGISQQQWHAQNPYNPVEHEAQLDQMRPGWRTEFPQPSGAQPPPAQSFYAPPQGGLSPLALAMLGRFGMRRR